MADQPEQEFKVEDLHITEAEIEAQQEMADRIRRRLHREGTLEYADPEERRAYLGRALEHRKNVARAAENARAGNLRDFHIPSADGIAEIAEQDPSTAHLFELGNEKPGTPEFHARHTPPPAQTIEVLGAEGAEGFGIVKRYDVTGTKEL